MRRKSYLLSENKKKFYYSDIAIGLLFLILLLSLGVLFVIYFRPLYYLDIHLLELDKATGLSVSTIRENYNALIQYCSPFYSGNLTFPSLSSSAQGISHFAEVKVIFIWFHITAVISYIALSIIIWYKKKNKQYSYLLVSSITVIVFPIITGLVCFINFNWAFTLMHKLFFRNDDWIFDPKTDPIINLLPETFFLHCALVIIGILLIGSLIMYLIYRHIRNLYKSNVLSDINRNYFY